MWRWRRKLRKSKRRKGRRWMRRRRKMFTKKGEGGERED